MTEDDHSPGTGLLEGRKQNNGNAPLSRRDFLKGAGLLLAGGLLAACGSGVEPGWQAGDYYRTPTPASLLPSPMPGAETPFPQDLASFLALSSVLTGFDDLDPELGQVYLHSLQENPEFSGGLPRLYEGAGMIEGSAPGSIADLESAGLFSEEASRSLADHIIELWYTGLYGQEDEQTVATFVDALAWKSITFTKPPTICGSFGFWAERPKGNY
jgi:hypothetical protein